MAGIYDETTGERPKAWIICKEGFNLDAAKLRRFCKKQLADYKVPREFEVVGNFPRSQIGKVLRRELVRLDQEKNIPVEIGMFFGLYIFSEKTGVPPSFLLGVGKIFWKSSLESVSTSNSFCATASNCFRYLVSIFLASL